MTSRGAFVASSRSGEIVWEDFEEKAKKVWTAKKKKTQAYLYNLLYLKGFSRKMKRNCSPCCWLSFWKSLTFLRLRSHELRQWLCPWRRGSIFLFWCASSFCGRIVWDSMTRSKTTFVCNIHLPIAWYAKHRHFEIRQMAGKICTWMTASAQKSNTGKTFFTNLKMFS